MRKLKLLFTGLALVGGVLSASAQTDVTTTYLPNADFEGSYTSLATVTGTSLDSRSVQDPADWEIAFGGTFHRWDSSVLSSSDATYSSNISKRITIPGASGFGSQTYAFRCQGTNTGEILRLYQSPILPRGRYTLSAQLHTQHKDNMEASIYVGTHSSGRIKADKNCAKDEWVEKSKSFDLTESKAVELGIYFSHNTASDYTAGVDNVKLLYSNYTTELSSMIAKATALSNASLASAISTAQGILDAADNTVAYQTTIDNAVSTLQTAIISAQNTNGSTLTAAVKNPGFEGTQMWYVKTTGADTYHADAWMNSSPFTSEVYHYSTTTTDQKSEGSQSYKVRFNWADASAELSQTIPGLSLGRYVITADVKATNGSNSSIEAYIKGNSTKGESVTAATSGFQTISATVDLNAAGNLDIILGMGYDYTGDGSSGSEAIMYWDNITLTYYNPEELYNSTKLTAQSTYNNAEYNNVTGDERTTLYNLLNPDPAPSTVEQYFQAIDDINDAVAAFTAAKTNYDKYAAEKARAITMGVASGDITAMTLASQYTTRLQELIVLEDAAVTSGYPEDATEVVGDWSRSNADRVTDTPQHWSGESRLYYNHSEQWGFTMSVSKTITLPAGKYVFKAAARAKADGVWDDGLSLQVSDEENVTFIPQGSAGRGIDKYGNAKYAEADDTYANSNNGYGWEWRFLPFELAEEKSVTLKVEAICKNGWSWASFTDVTLLTKSDNIDVFAQIYNSAKEAATSARDNATYANVDGSEKKALNDAIDAEVPEPATLAWYKTQASTLNSATATFTSNDVKTAYNNLATAISSANSIVEASTNVGTGVFQVPTSIRETLSGAASTASSTKSNEATTYSDASTAATTLNTAITTYNTAFAAAELNAPAEGAVFNVMITTNDSYGFKDKPLTFNSDNASGANFIKANGVAPYRAQQITFTKVSGNQYTLSMINADGDRVYIRTNAPGKGGDGSTSQIRLTTVPENALAVQVIPSTTTNGVYTLKNTEADALLGCQDADSKPSGGLYTVGSHNNFTITEATKPSVSVTIASDVKFATRIFPFKPTLPDGVKAYSCEAKNASDYLSLVEVAEPAANVPYILYAENGSSGTLTGYGTATQDSYDAGWLNGVYTDTEAPVGSYVLQKHGSEVAFYQVASGEESKPTVGAYRCYLMVPNGGGEGDARALYFDFDETTAVETIQALTAGKNTIYNVAGKVVPSLQKGLNIIKTSDGKIRKVIVK